MIRPPFRILMLLGFTVSCVPRGQGLSQGGGFTGGATMVAPGVISTGDVFGAVLSREGTMYFVKQTGPGRLVLMESTNRDGRWMPPMALPFSGSYRDIDPYLTPDGSLLYFNSNRPRPGDTGSRLDVDVWVVSRGTDGWSSPRNIGPPVNSDSSDYFATTTRRGTIYFSRLERGSGGPSEYIYRATMAGGKFSVPERSDSTINDGHNNNNPLISPDERVLIFSSDRPGGYGETDLYVTVNRAGRWMTPRNLGSEVNSAGWEFAPSVAPDGKQLFFTRRELVNGKPGGENIFVVPWQWAQPF